VRERNTKQNTTVKLCLADAYYLTMMHNQTPLICRACGTSMVNTIVDYGETPIADVLLESVDQRAAVAPLSLAFCKPCKLLQLGTSVTPESVYNQAYPYFSSAITSLVSRMKDLADELCAAYHLDQHSKIMEIASNDGYLLQHFKTKGITPLGIEPAERQADVAQQYGIETLTEFFDQQLAKKIIDERGLFDLIIANNVIAHIPDINGTLNSIASLLNTNGMAVFEFHDAGAMINLTQFDTIYHQHIFYFTFSSFEPLLNAAGLSAHKVESISAYGGALRVHACLSTSDHCLSVDKSVEQQRLKETTEKLGEHSTYTNFAQRVEENKAKLSQYITWLKSHGKRIVAYGAAAKACTLATVCNLDEQHIDYFVDQNPIKHGLFMPGNTLPIFPVNKLIEDRPDYLLILAWNYADEVMQALNWYCEQGGRFIIPIPEVRVLPND